MTIIHHSSFDFSFDPSACRTCGGRCCRGESGEIAVTEREIDAMARQMNLTKFEFQKRWLVRKNGVYSIRERRETGGEFACIFFDDTAKTCSIYEIRPQQCRTFPFWDHYFFKKDSTFYDCPGIVHAYE